MTKDFGERKSLAHLQAFRGLAILCIVGAHSFSFAIDLIRPETQAAFDPYLDAGTRAVFHGSTIFFTLISGLLFTAVLRGRPWGQFYKRKLTGVLGIALIAIGGLAPIAIARCAQFLLGRRSRMFFGA